MKKNTVQILINMHNDASLRKQKKNILPWRKPVFHALFQRSASFNGPLFTLMRWSYFSSRVLITTSLLACHTQNDFHCINRKAGEL